MSMISHDLSSAGMAAASSLLFWHLLHLLAGGSSH
jgi:hypothetical protein